MQRPIRYHPLDDADAVSTSGPATCANCRTFRARSDLSETQPARSQLTREGRSKAFPPIQAETLFNESTRLAPRSIGDTAGLIADRGRCRAWCFRHYSDFQDEEAWEISPPVPLHPPIASEPASLPVDKVRPRFGAQSWRMTSAVR